MTPTGSALTFVNLLQGVSCLPISNWFFYFFFSLIVYLNACTGVFVSAERSFRTSSFDIFAINPSRLYSVSNPTSLQLGYLKFPFTTSFVCPQWGCSRVSVLPCFRVKASYLSKVTFRSLRNKVFSISQKFLVEVSWIFKSG